MITMDKGLIDPKALKKLLNATYWAENRTLETIEKSMKHSECIAVLEDDQLVGFARIVTDYSTMFWLCDVVVDPEYRGHGIGKQMMEHLCHLPYYKDLKGILATGDAHGLYEKYGFKKEAYKLMWKDRGVDGFA